MLCDTHRLLVIHTINPKYYKVGDIMTVPIFGNYVVNNINIRGELTASRITAQELVKCVSAKKETGKPRLGKPYYRKERY